MFVHGLIFVVLWEHRGLVSAEFLSLPPPFYNIRCDASRVQSYGKFLIQSKRARLLFWVHISSTPVVKYLMVIRAYLFKWWGNIKYHRFSAETGQWLSTDVCQLGNVHWCAWLCESFIGQMKQEHENGEVVSSWGWLKFPHNVCTYKERKWGGKFEKRKPWVVA